MSKIWKTHLNLTVQDQHGDLSTEIESMGVVLNVGLDPAGVPSVWYWAPDDDHRLKTKIVLVGTGIETVEWMGGYKGTIVYGSLVLHAFEVSAW